jgi:hypothetical protein
MGTFIRTRPVVPPMNVPTEFAFLGRTEVFNHDHKVHSLPLSPFLRIL